MNINKVNLLDYKGDGGRSLARFLPGGGRWLLSKEEEEEEEECARWRTGLRVEERGGFCTLSPLCTRRKVGGGTDRFKPRRVPERAQKSFAEKRILRGKSRRRTSPRRRRRLLCVKTAGVLARIR